MPLTKNNVAVFNNTRVQDAIGRVCACSSRITSTCMRFLLHEWTQCYICIRCVPILLQKKPGNWPCAARTGGAPFTCTRIFTRKSTPVRPARLLKRACSTSRDEWCRETGLICSQTHRPLSPWTAIRKIPPKVPRRCTSWADLYPARHSPRLIFTCQP